MFSVWLELLLKYIYLFAMKENNCDNSYLRNYFVCEYCCRLFKWWQFYNNYNNYCPIKQYK